MADVTVINTAIQKLGYSALKKEQEDVIVGFLSGRDVFAVLPTGFGKTLCYACLPLVFDGICPLRDGQSSIVLIITPLTAIMKDQCLNLKRKGLKVGIVGVDSEAALFNGEYQVVFSSPEILFMKKKWRIMLTSPVYSAQLRALVIDEAHTCKNWGKTFRPLLLRVGEIRSLLPKNVNVMALTATATTQSRKEISGILGVQNPLVIAISPFRTNIIYSVKEFVSVYQTFYPLVEAILNNGLQVPKTVIFCRRMDDCSELYAFFRRELKEKFTFPTGAPDIPQFRMVDMFTSCIEPEIKDTILEYFTKKNNPRVLVATVAFGMGIDCPDIREIVHLGPPDNIESYVQETGRASRDGCPALALLLRKNVRCTLDDDMKEYMFNNTTCRRTLLFKKFDNYPSDLSRPCCDICVDETSFMDSFIKL